jgi:HEAT repeat protein
MEDRLDIARRLQYHTSFLQQVAKSTAEVDITWNLDDVRRSLQFIAAHGAEAGSTAAAVTARIFARTKDDQTRRACLDSLSRIHSPKAKNELLRISQNNDVDKVLRDLAIEYLRSPRVQPIAATVSGAPAIIGQP